MYMYSQQLCNICSAHSSNTILSSVANNAGNQEKMAYGYYTESMQHLNQIQKPLK